MTMNNQFRVGQAYFPSKPGGVVKKPVSAPVQKPFEHWLQEQLTSTANTTQAPKLSFSQHALGRLEQRGITLTEADVAKLEGAVQRAASKGAKESLILMNHVAYVVSVANRKVITAVDEAHMKENVFTNIDSAVFV